MRYIQLTNFLSQMTDDSVTFTLDELNVLLAGTLPNCARNHPHANFANSTGNSYSSAWMSLGFKAKYNKFNNSVTFYRADIETPPVIRETRRQQREAGPMPTTLLIKNFNGSFNENGVGHEIINSFDSNNNNTDYYLFYVPPYGSIKNETIEFINQPEYQSFQKILVFDSTTITNVLKLKSVILQPICIQSEEEMLNIANSFRFGPNNIALRNIDFNDSVFQADRDEADRVTLFPFTYKVLKTQYFNLESENLFIWHSRTEATNLLRDDSIRKFHIVYGEDLNIAILENTSIALGSQR